MSLGYPDWQDYPQWSGNATVINSQPVSNVTPYTQDFQLGNFSSIFFFTNAPLFGVNVSIFYWADSTKTKGLGGYTWTVQAATVLEVVVPNLGPFVTISVSMTQTGSMNIGVEVIPLNVPVSRCSYPRQNNRLGQSTTAGAGVTLNFNMPQTMEGTVYAAFIPGDAAGKLNYSVTENTIASVTSTALIAANLITTPAFFTSAANNQPLGVNIVNTDGVSGHPFTARVIVLPAG